MAADTYVTQRQRVAYIVDRIISYVIHGTLNCCHTVTCAFFQEQNLLHFVKIQENFNGIVGIEIDGEKIAVVRELLRIDSGIIRVGIEHRVAGEFFLSTRDEFQAFLNYAGQFSFFIQNSVECIETILFYLLRNLREIRNFLP